MLPYSFWFLNTIRTVHWSTSGKQEDGIHAQPHAVLDIRFVRYGARMQQAMWSETSSVSSHHRRGIGLVMQVSVRLLQARGLPRAMFPAVKGSKVGKFIA
jgi:hypothetical protein